MQLKFLIIPTVLIFQTASAQTNSGTLSASQVSTTAPVSAIPASTANTVDSGAAMAPSISTQVAIIDYQSVFETATIEEEVKMATERFSLTPAQQEVWLTAATDRRTAENISREKLNSKDPNVSRDNVYRGLRTAHNTFNETITGYLTPTQKQSMETDRVILEEKRKRLAKLPPPPPPAPTVTVAPVDSVAIKEAELQKTKGKKGKKAKKKG